MKLFHSTVYSTKNEIKNSLIYVRVFDTRKDAKKNMFKKSFNYQDNIHINEEILK